MTKIRKSFTLSLFIVASFGIQAEEKPSADTPSDDVEVIEVYGQVPLGTLKSMMKEAERNFMKSFNDYNDDPLFEFTCTRKAKTGSHIKKETCEPNYLTKARSNLYQYQTVPSHLGNALIRNPTEAQVKRSSKSDKQLAEEHMKKILSENEELQEMYAKYQHARKAYVKTKLSQGK